MDRGPGPNGEDATQIVTLDVQTGKRTQLTCLPGPAVPLNYVTGHARFVDDDTVRFQVIGPRLKPGHGSGS